MSEKPIDTSKPQTMNDAFIRSKEAADEKNLIQLRRENVLLKKRMDLAAKHVMDLLNRVDALENLSGQKQQP